LYDYNARYYDPLLGRFVSADSMVPGAGNPQNLNRYTYVNNSPLNYTDPSGHCINKDGDETRGDLFDCSKDELDALSWEIRASWITKLGEKGGAAGWFDNIVDILNFFNGNSYLRNDPYVSASDAGLLWVIQEGFRDALRGGSANAGLKAVQLWGAFFREVNSPDYHHNGLAAAHPYFRSQQLTQLWGQAEKAGTAYGVGYATDDRRLSAPTGRAGDTWNNFVAIGDAYRSWQASGDSQAPGLAGPVLNVAYWALGAPNAKMFGRSPVWFGAQAANSWADLTNGLTGYGPTYIHPGSLR
jgi:hypothetical protein